MYVAMTRGKKENRAYAVCEPVFDRTAEDGHMHSAGDYDAPTPIGLLTSVLEHNSHQASAIETLRQEFANATSDERLEQLYRHGVDLAARDFTAATLPDYIDALPRAYAHQLEADPHQHDALTQAWTEAATRGLDPRDMWHDATETLDTADKPGAVIAYRIRHVTREDGDTTTRPTPPPATPGCDTELSTWLADTHRTLTVAPESGQDAATPEDAANDFLASYLAHRATEQESGPDAATASGPQWSWGATTDSSPEL